MDTSDFNPKITDVGVPANTGSLVDPSHPGNGPATVDQPLFVPLVPPPSDHHPLNTGLGTEFGDTARGLMQKVNAGFAGVFSRLEELGASSVKAVKEDVLPSKVITTLQDWIFKNFVSITEHKALADKVTALETAAVQPPLSGELPVEMVTKAEFDAAQTKLEEMSSKFDTLGDRIETFLGIGKKK